MQDTLHLSSKSPTNHTAMIDLNIPWPVNGPNAASPSDRAKVASAKASIIMLQEREYG